MSLNYRVEPLTDADSIAGDGVPSNFSASWTDTLLLLDRELRALDARDVVLQLDVLAGQLTKDGRLRARSKSASRAVRISWEGPDGPVHIDTAEFVRGYGASMAEDWQHNVRAIALGLEALRKVDRYGIARGKQYAGFKALGAGSGAVAMGGMTLEQALEVLDQWASLPGVWNLESDGERVYRRARANAHPDHPTGSREAWDQVEQAGRVLGLDR